MSTNRINFLQEKYPQISKEDFLAIIACDTTPTKKYSDWLLRIYANKKLDITNLQPIIETIEIHIGLKDDVDVELRDINKFSSVEDFMIALNKWLINRFSENENSTKYFRKGAELIFENEDIVIVKVISYEGSINFGSNTSWCTLKYDDYVRYAKAGCLFIVTSKTNRYTKIFSTKTQLSFSNSEFRDRTNEEIDLLKSISSHMELYQPFEKCYKLSQVGGDIQKARLIHSFFNFESCTNDNRKELIDIYGFSILKAIENYTYSMIYSLFESFDQRIYSYIPTSEDKNRAFVSVVKEGLKILHQKGENISEDIYTRAVEAFPENIVFVPTADDSLWRYAVRNEPWLMPMSPFFKNKNINEIISLIVDNPMILTYFEAEDFIAEEKRYELAVTLLDNVRDDLIFRLKIKSEKYQLLLVEKTYSCLPYLIKPSAAVIAKAKEMERIEKELNDKRKAEIADAKEVERKRREKSDYTVIRKPKESKKIYETEDFLYNKIIDDGNLIYYSDCISELYGNKYKKDSPWDSL